jgi:hypothetical protein
MIASLIPPRPAGYRPSKELFEKNTGLAFDVLSPAEAAVDFPLSFLYNSERLNRMAQYEATGGLGIGEMTKIIIQQTWKSPRKQGMLALIQLQTEQLLLTYLLAAMADENNSYVVRATLQNELTDLKTFITERLKTSTDETYKGHLQLALERIKTPEKARSSNRKEMPPGAPIGDDADE